MRKKTLTIEIFDVDGVKIGDFLGMVRIDAKDLLYPSPHAQIMELTRNPALTKKKNNLVQGSVKFFVTRVFSEQSTRRWRLLRKYVKVAARHALKLQLLEDPDNVDKMVKLGMLCASTNGANVSMMRCAAVLLSIASERDYKGNGAFWKTLSAMHMRTWLSEGLRSEVSE